MKFLIVAVGVRMPRWVDEAFDEYARRMPRTHAVELKEVRAEPRAGGKPVAQLLAAEAVRLSRAVPRGVLRVALDERGREFDTAQLARWVAARENDGRDCAFLVGGPDGLAAETKSDADLLLRLSAMTLPHGLARVLLAEQLYRAVAILGNHPYHRE